MSDYPKKAGSGESTFSGYSVEARYAGHEPKIIGEQIMDNRWRRVNTNDSPIGIPRNGLYGRELEQHGLFGYSSAQAIRWWFHAIADASPMGGLCLETRIVKHEIKAKYECNAVSDHLLIGGDDRSNRMPDWGIIESLE